jgi:anti-anti-sigma factor
MSSSELHIVIEQAQGRVPVTIIQVEGSVDAANYQALQAAVDKAYTAGARYVLFDLANVPYMSSAGLRVLHQLIDRLGTESAAEGNAALRLEAAGDSLKSPHVKLLNPSKNVSRLLEVSGFKMFFDIYSDRDTAIASF